MWPRMTLEPRQRCPATRLPRETPMPACKHRASSTRSLSLSRSPSEARSASSFPCSCVHASRCAGPLGLFAGRRSAGEGAAFFWSDLRGGGSGGSPAFFSSAGDGGVPPCFFSFSGGAFFSTSLLFFFFMEGSWSLIAGFSRGGGWRAALMVAVASSNGFAAWAWARISAVSGMRSYDPRRRGVRPCVRQSVSTSGKTGSRPSLLKN